MDETINALNQSGSAQVLVAEEEVRHTEVSMLPARGGEIAIRTYAHERDIQGRNLNVADTVPIEPMEPFGICISLILIILYLIVSALAINYFMKSYQDASRISLFCGLSACFYFIGPKLHRKWAYYAGLLPFLSFAIVIFWIAYKDLNQPEEDEEHKFRAD